MTATPKRILIFGGTFDPPHRAHVDLPVLVARELECERIVYVPAAQNPLKGEPPIASAEHRLAMLRLAIRAMPIAAISTVELDRGGPSYFVETLEALRAELGDGVNLHFLIGADQAVDFRRWKDCERILRLATPAVLLRPPWTRDRLLDALVGAHGEDEGRRWMDRVTTAPLLDVSATELRRTLAAGEEPIGALDAAVAAYVREHGLYVR